MIASNRRRHGLGLLMALASLSLLAWHLDRPALWLDESASAVATQRSWPHLWLLLRGDDAPLVPFYALLKALTSATTTMFPAAAQHPELLLRWPSALAAVLAAWLLTVWLGRFVPAPAVLGCGVFLLATAGFSRYGQEARPYAVVLLVAITATVLWERMVNDGRRWAGPYVLAVVALIAANSLAGTLVLAHLVAALIAPGRSRRWSALRRTVAAAAAAGLLVAPLAVTVTRNGGGASRYPTLTPENLSLAFIHLFTGGDHRVFWIGTLLPFAGLGLTRVISQEYGFVARLAAAWAIVPPLVLLPAVLTRPNLLIGRYLMFVVPAWAVLGGLGVVSAIELIRRVTGHRTPAVVVAAGLLAGAVVSQVPWMEQVREPGGHGEDLRPGLAAAEALENARLPIYVTTQLGAIEVGAYDRAAEGRLIDLHIQRDLTSIWPTADPPPVRAAELRTAPTLLLLMRAAHQPGCDTTAPEPDAAVVARCLPPALQHRKYQVISFQRSPAWTFALLRRPVGR